MPSESRSYSRSIQRSRDKRRRRSSYSQARSPRNHSRSSRQSARKRSPQNRYSPKRDRSRKQRSPRRRSPRRQKSPHRHRNPYNGNRRSPYRRHSPHYQRKYSPRPRSPKRIGRQEEKIDQSKKLFITNIDGQIPSEEVKEDLRKQFQVFGTITDIVVKCKLNSSNTYAFIDFQRIQDSVAAQNKMQSKMFKGKELKVQFGKGERKLQDRQSGQCYNCHRDGHYARQCNQRRRNRYGGHNERSRSYSRSRKHRRRHSYSSSQSRGSYKRRRRSFSRDRDYGRRRDQGRRDRSPRYSRGNY